MSPQVAITIAIFLFFLVTGFAIGLAIWAYVNDKRKDD